MWVITYDIQIPGRAHVLAVDHLPFEIDGVDLFTCDKSMFLRKNTVC